MKGIVNKILIGVSLAVIIALAVPLSFMTAAIVRGESPRQTAENDMADDLAENDVLPGDDESTDTPAPVVQPDPGTPSVQETQPEPSTKAEPEAAVQPAAAPSVKSGSAKKSNPSAAEKTQPAQVQPKNTLPKAVLAPGEAPCMVDGLDGYTYDYS